ncbi:DUF4041 domain-containing protein [Geomicrobium sp. JCM 19039]|uniref:DUF4041 domain-containing protein n=1 Tax=Geomicrobium sp. JCM 19039 TaxID=1460636 RepID=UPI00045F4179|nr:DUF4041 domain-containing protein [Geomicrobium sp. JCM 19039]GAK11354.1 chromosome segregation ATPase [Geomicrobium sp. JCM 19039]
MRNSSNYKKSLEKRIKNLREERKVIKEKYKKENKLLNELPAKKNELTEVTNRVNKLKDEVVILEEEILYQSFGFYDSKYKLETSQHYKDKLKELRDEQKTMARNKQATVHNNEFTFNGSKQKGKAFVHENVKMVLRAFNVECENAISKVTFSNIHSVEKRILNSAKSIEKTNKLGNIRISEPYLILKINELYLAYEYEQKKQEEKEEQKLIREQMREEAKAQKEIAAMKAKILKEETHFNNKIKKLETRMNNSLGDENNELNQKIAELNAQLLLLAKDKENVHFREQNTRAGYVYIISNIGSFGDNVYKIGVTRRLEPFDRVKELGSASVPFNFDVHAMIFSDDAPKLEKQLHDQFINTSVNKINTRKEFFNVTLEEIERFVNANHDKTVIFTKIAEADEYRRTVALEKETRQQLSTVS